MIVNIHDTKSEKAMAPHSSTLAWKIPWTEEPGRLQFMGSWRVLKSDFPFTFHFHTLEKEMATHSSVLAWRIPGMGEPGGLPSVGSHRVGHDWSDLAAATEQQQDQPSVSKGPRSMLRFSNYLENLSLRSQFWDMIVSYKILAYVWVWDQGHSFALQG